MSPLLHARRTSLVASSIVLLAIPAGAQSGTPPDTVPPAVGEIAPDFTLPGATRHGVLRDEVRLSDYRGRTVVLAFFFKARTRG